MAGVGPEQERDGRTNGAAVARSHPTVALVLVAAMAFGASLSPVRSVDATSLAVAPVVAETLWGVDSADPITPSFLGSIARALGTPDFFGRYLGGSYGMTKAEVDLAFSHGIRILVLDDASGTADQTTYAKGQAGAAAAVASAIELGVPAGVAIFRDVEESSAIDPAFVQGYVDTMAESSYLPAFYGNPVNGQFASAYCEAVASNPADAAAYFFSSENEPGRGPQWQAPLFEATSPPCASRTVAWQYGEPGTVGGLGPDRPGGYCARTGICPNVDTDEALSTLPFWSLGGPTRPGALFDAGFEGGTSGWTVAGNTTFAVHDGPAGKPKEGVRYAQIRTSSRPGAISQSMPVPTEPGQTYTFSVWVRTDLSSKVPFVGSIVLFGLGSTTEAGSTSFRAVNSWTLVSARFTATAPHTRLVAAIYLDTTRGILDADGALLVPGVDASGGRPGPDAGPGPAKTVAVRR
jgi:hypothetical protein